MLTQFYGNEIIQKLEKTSSTVVTLPAGSKIKLGGQGANLNSSLSLNTSIVGDGGMESSIQPSTLYYVYAIIDGVTEKLTATSSELKPSNFSAYRKVGAFFSDGNSEVVYTYHFNHQDETEWIDADPSAGVFINNVTSYGNVVYNTLKFKLTERDIILKFELYKTTAGSHSSVPYDMVLPKNLQFDTSKVQLDNIVGLGDFHGRLGSGIFHHYQGHTYASTATTFRAYFQYQAEGAGATAGGGLWGSVGAVTFGEMQFAIELRGAINGLKKLDWNHY